MSAREEIAGLIVKNIELQERIEALEAALRGIVSCSKRTGPPDLQYWWDIANERRDIARAALNKDTSE